MKPFIVKPFIVNPDWTKWYQPQWSLSGTAWTLLFLGGISFSYALGAPRQPDDFMSLSLIGITMLLIASGFWDVVYFWRETNKGCEALTNRIAEQDDRIRKLEEQLTALTVERTTEPHAS